MTDFNFTITRLDFTARATTPIALGEYKGSALRGAWNGYMQKAYCGAPPHARTDPMHQTMCPVCYLTSRETGPESRRPYALIPPLDHSRGYEPGDTFRFSFSLFGNNAAMLFPYVLLSLRELGVANGLGSYVPELNGRGRFELIEVAAIDPHSGGRQRLWHEADAMVQTPSFGSNGESVGAAAERLAAALDDGLLKLRLLTPLRLIDEKRLMHRFEFAVLMQRALERLYGLAQNFSGNPERYGREALIADKNRLMPLAERVQVVGDDTVWWDVQGFSGLKKDRTYLGGLVGDVILYCPDWKPLLPYLLWASSTQIGKNVVKGCGHFALADATMEGVFS